MKNRSLNTGFALLTIITVILCLFFSQCRKSEEELIRDTLGQIGKFAEKRDIEGVLSFISADYSDDEKHTYLDIETLLNEYFDRCRGIVVNVLDTKIIKIKLPEAEIQTEVALSSGAAKIFRKAVRCSGEFYRFDLTLVKEGEKWRCKYAFWETITLEDLFPESAKIIKKLFPNVL